MVHLAQQGLGAVSGQADLLLSRLVLALQPAAQQGVIQGGAQQGGEVLGHVLDDIVRRAGPQRGHGDAALLRPGDIDHRRRRRQRHDIGQHIQTVATRHVVIQGADVVLTRRQGMKPRIAVGRAGHGVSVASELLFNETRQSAIIVDVEQAYGRRRVQGLFVRPYSITGACITDRNRPS